MATDSDPDSFEARVVRASESGEALQSLLDHMAILPERAVAAGSVLSGRIEQFRNDSSLLADKHRSRQPSFARTVSTCL
jgi:hypothetical protein